jgi:hypothetical protein
VGNNTGKIAVIAALSTLWPTFASPQQGGVAAPAYGTTPTTPASGTATSATAAAAVGAQPAAPAGGLQIDIGISTSMKADSNFSLTPGSSPGTSYINDTKLSFGLTNVTSAHDLNITATGVIRFADIPGRSVAGFEDPTVRWRYLADGVNSRLTFDGLYRDVDREFLNPFQVEREELLSGGLITDGGKLRNTTAHLGYQTGLAAPLGFAFDLRHDKRDYSNVTNTRLFDNKKDSATATVTMKVSPVATARLSTGVTNYTADDAVQTDRTTTDYAIGATYDVNPILQLDAQIGHTNVKTDTITGTTTRSGVTGSLSATQTRQNGTVFGSVSMTRNQNGQRTKLQFGRDYQLKNGTVRGALGVTQADLGGSSWIGSLAYSVQLPSGSLGVTFTRDAATNSSNQEIVDTRLGLSYAHAINNSSSLDLSLDWGRSEDTNATGAQTIVLTDLTAAYTRNLTPDWNLSGGVTFRHKTETGRADANSTALFVQLGRNFQFRP